MNSDTPLRRPQTRRLALLVAGSFVCAAASFVLAAAHARGQPPADGGRLAALPSAPAQPATGFGGRDYAYSGIEHEAHGRGDESYWIFRPSGVADACSRPQAPPIVFLHGWGAMNPRYYGAWIEHLVRRGHVVVYPRYQETLRTPPAAMTGHVVAAVRDAFARLDVDCRWAVIGHSLGGALAANLAVRASTGAIGAPGAPTAVLAVEPGRALDGLRGPVMALDDLSKLDADTVLVTVAGDADRVVGDLDARQIFVMATGIPDSRKRYVVVRSDHHGRPALEANHHAPTAPLDALNLLSDEPSGSRKRVGWRMTAARRDLQTIDALDYYAFWKLTDGLVALASTGTDDIFSPANVCMLADMGRWSDGRAVAELAIYAELPPAP
jgi:acetyl esterase/lipase